MTIHNINDSKFLANQHVPISNHVEITRIPAEKAQKMTTTTHCDKLAVGSERRTQQGNGSASDWRQQQHHHAGPVAAGGGHPESVFEPAQINLNERSPDERDIESFKRFNYFFEPPKSKMKVNLNVQDIYNSRGQESPSNSTWGQ